MRRLVLLIATAVGLLAAAPAHAASPPTDGNCTTGTSGSYPAVSCLNKTWHCSTKQNHTQVNVKIDSPAAKLDAVHLDSGCTGVIRLTITTNSGDGVKVHAGAHDLVVWGGAVHPGSSAIICTGKTGIVHQDGIQAMGGNHVTFEWFRVWCPSGNNGGLYVHHGAGDTAGQPTAIVCDHCDLFENNAAFHIGPGAVSSGARFSKLHDGKTAASPPNCRRIDKEAVDPVDEENTCLTPKG